LGTGEVASRLCFSKVAETFGNKCPNAMSWIMRSVGSNT